MRTLACTSWSQGAANKIGRLADSINTKSAHQAYRVGDNERCGLLCCVARSLVPGMYRQRLQLIRTPWHHLVGYQSLGTGMYRQRRRSYALLGAISSAIKAWVLACIASACSSYALLHHLISYHSLVPRMHRQRLHQGNSYALLGTTSSAISTSPIVAIRIAVKRSFFWTCAFEGFGFLRNGRFFVFMLSSFCFHAVLCNLTTRTLAFPSSSFD